MMGAVCAAESTHLPMLALAIICPFLASGRGYRDSAGSCSFGSPKIFCGPAISLKSFISLSLEHITASSLNACRALYTLV